MPQARPRSAGCAEHRPEPLLQGRLRGLPQRIDSRAVAARSTLQSRGNGGRRSSFPPWRTWRRGGPQLLRLPHRTSRRQRTHLRGRNFAHIRCGTLRGAILLGGVPAVFRPRADALRAAPQRTVRQRVATGLLPQRVRHAGRGREARGRSGLRNRGIVRGVATPADGRNAPAYRTQRLRTFLLGRLRLSGIRLPVRGSVQERRSETCSGHDGRQPPCPLPSGDIRFYRDFLSIDLLFRPERLLERYERDRDRREMPCHILKH